MKPVAKKEEQEDAALKKTPRECISAEIANIIMTMMTETNHYLITILLMFNDKIYVIGIYLRIG